MVRAVERVGWGGVEEAFEYYPKKHETPQK
jgi:hypothetical protein